MIKLKNRIESNFINVCKNPVCLELMTNLTFNLGKIFIPGIKFGIGLSYKLGCGNFSEIVFNNSIIGFISFGKHLAFLKMQIYLFL